MLLFQVSLCHHSLLIAKLHLSFDVKRADRIIVWIFNFVSELSHEQIIALSREISPQGSFLTCLLANVVAQKIQLEKKQKKKVHLIYVEQLLFIYSVTHI